MRIACPVSHHLAFTAAWAIAQIEDSTAVWWAIGQIDDERR
jgi:hypothetical protein